MRTSLQSELEKTASKTSADQHGFCG